MGRKEASIKIIVGVLLIGIATTILIFLTSIQNNIESRALCNDIETPTNLTFSGHFISIQVLWNNLERRDCNDSFVLSYKINNVAEDEVTTMNPFYTTTTWYWCYIFDVKIWAVNELGERNEKYAKLTHIENPHHSDMLLWQTVQFSPTDYGLELRWSKFWEMKYCNNTFQLEITTDTNPQAVMHYVTTENMTVANDAFCFRVWVRFIALINGVASRPSTHTFTGLLEAPTKVSIIFSRTENTVTATWSTHPREKDCSIQYHVSYEFGDFQRNYTTSDHVMTFDMEYCTITVVQVTGISGDIIGNSVTARNTEGLPDSVGPVRHIQIDEHIESPNTITVSWSSPAFMSECSDIVYEVTAKNYDTGHVDTCRGESFCEINLENFCPHTIITVQAISILSEDAVKLYAPCPQDS